MASVPHRITVTLKSGKTIVITTIFENMDINDISSTFTNKLNEAITNDELLVFETDVEVFMVKPSEIASIMVTKLQKKEESQCSQS